MKTIIKWILSIFVGSIIGLFLMLLTGESLYFLLTCGAFAFLAAGVSYGLFSNSSLKGLLAAAGAVVGFILYFYIMDFVNESSLPDLLCMAVFFLPYILLVYVLSSAHGNKNNAEQNEASQ